MSGNDELVENQINKDATGNIALIGNPNAGKTTIFNSLTGSRQHVGNWPGVTVEKKLGYLKSNKKIKVIDLPGTYSLGAYSEDELVARNYILFENPDVVIDVMDASNIKRNMYLALQLMEMGANVVIALNIIDEAEKKNIVIDSAGLANLLNVPVVPMIATKNQGIDGLIISANKVFVQKKEPLKIDYGKEIENEVENIKTVLEKNNDITRKYSSRWLALKILEGDENILSELKVYANAEKILHTRQQAKQRLEKIFGDDSETIVIEKRYGFIEGIVKKVVKKNKSVEGNVSLSDKIDGIVLNKYFGIPIFLIAMWAVFKFTFVLGEPLIGYIETFFKGFGKLAQGVFTNQMVSSFVVDGVIGGLGSILVFIPNIFLLFFAISLLEDSGYMARAAYVMDRFMRMLGLQGKSFIPLLMGFGCSVPAVMATRTLEDKNDRMTTLLIAPLMSCSARLPVYVLFVSAFFSNNQSLILFSIYILGIVLAIIMGKLFKIFLFPGETTPFIMELPPYRLPTLKGTLIHMWEKGSSFIKKAGTIIFAVVVLVWALSSFPWGVDYASQESLMGRIGSFIAPIFAPLGFGTWEAASSLIFGLLAKEVVVGTLGVLYGVSDGGLVAVVSQMWTPLAAYSFMAMTLIYIPCVAVLGAIKRETDSYKWVGFAVLYTLILGWIVSFIIYQGGLLLGLG